MARDTMSDLVAFLAVARERSGGQFDPALVQIFQRCASHFERIFHELAD